MASKKIQQIFEYDEEIFNITLHPNLLKMLLDYQRLHVQILIRALQKHKVAVDTSSTGTGKTYTSLAVAKHLKLRVFIICPKSMISVWKRLASQFELDFTVINYEAIRTGKAYPEYLEKINA